MGRAASPLFPERVLQQLKLAHPFGVEHHDFTVENGLLRRQPGRHSGDGLTSMRPVLAIAADEPGLAIFEPADHSIAIKLDFVQPIAALRRTGDERRQLRFD